MKKNMLNAALAIGLGAILIVIFIKIGTHKEIPVTLVNENAQDTTSELNLTKTGSTHIGATQDKAKTSTAKTKYDAYGACCEALHRQGVSGFHVVHDECVDYGDGEFIIVGTANINGIDKRWAADIKYSGNDSWKLVYPIKTSW